MPRNLARVLFLVALGIYVLTFAGFWGPAYIFDSGATFLLYPLLALPLLAVWGLLILSIIFAAIDRKWWIVAGATALLLVSVPVLWAGNLPYIWVTGELPGFTN